MLRSFHRIREHDKTRALRINAGDKKNKFSRTTALDVRVRRTRTNHYYRLLPLPVTDSRRSGRAGRTRTEPHHHHSPPNHAEDARAFFLPIFQPPANDRWQCNALYRDRGNRYGNGTRTTSNYDDGIFCVRYHARLGAHPNLYFR